MGSCESSLMGSSAPSPEVMAKVQQIIAQNPVVIFTKTTCPYCASTRRLLKKNHARYLDISIDRERDGSAMKAALRDLTGQNTVPNIFIARQHIGGNSELQGRKSELPALLHNAGAL